MRQMTWKEFSEAYCETQMQSPKGLGVALDDVITRYNPDGFMLLECVVLDSSLLGQRVILPFGGSATWKELPKEGQCISPRGLASDMSQVVGWVSRMQVETREGKEK